MTTNAPRPQSHPSDKPLTLTERLKCLGWAAAMTTLAVSGVIVLIACYIIATAAVVLPIAGVMLLVAWGLKAM